MESLFLEVFKRFVDVAEEHDLVIGLSRSRRWLDWMILKIFSNLYDSAICPVYNLKPGPASAVPLSQVGQSTICLWSGPFLQICEGVPYGVKSALGNTKIISHFSVATLVSSKCQRVSAGALNSTPNRAFSKGLGKAWPQTASDF